MNILSIQSWVAYGHVGNAAAIFPLQRLGAEVWAVHTVQYSNHTGYGDFTGMRMPAETVRDLVAGIAARGALPRCDALLSGYLGTAAVGDAVIEAAKSLRAANPRALWCCDPVLGDQVPGEIARGLYVPEDLARLVATRCVKQADLLTPNQFELGYLTGLDTATLDGVRIAVARLRDMMRPEGPRAVVVTSFAGEQTPADAIDLLAAAGAQTHLLRLPRLDVASSGAGDVMAALLCFHFLRTGNIALALEWAASSLHGVLRRTAAEQSRELLLVDAQDEFAAPSRRFSAKRL